MTTISEHDIRRAVIRYDERLPVPPGLLEGRDPERLLRDRAFPVIEDSGTVVIAAADPRSVPKGEAEYIAGGLPYEIVESPARDVEWFIEDFMSDRPGRIIGTERTGLAFWRNTMAAWRTRLACYRTDLAKARVSLGILRWGLGIVTLAGAAAALDLSTVSTVLVYWGAVATGMMLTLTGVYHYLRIRRAMMKTPGPQTLVEVTAATVRFLEDYHLECEPRPETKRTMLSRLGDFLPGYCSILYPEPPSRERTHLARERDALAAQRTLAGCYRTIYSRARTGLAFIRTGIVFFSIGIGFMQYFQLGLEGLWGLLLFIAGALMIADGLLWYMPARREEPDMRRILTTPIEQA